MSRQTVKALQARVHQAYDCGDLRLVRRVSALLEYLTPLTAIPALCEKWDSALSPFYLWLHELLLEGLDSLGYVRITTEILDYVVREMTDAKGGFYSSQDADSERHEGKFFVWTPEEIRSAMATMVLMKLAAYTGHPGYVDTAEGAVAPLQPALAQAPTGFAWWLCALNFELAPPREIAIVGEQPEELLDVVFGEYRPNQVVAYTPVQEQDLPIPLLGDRPSIGGKATAYVCRHFACLMPVTKAEELRTQTNH